MNGRSSTALIILTLVLVAFGGGYFLGQLTPSPLSLFEAGPQSSQENRQAFAPVAEVWDLLHTRFYEQPLDDALLTEGAIEGMLAVLNDPQTQYFSPEEEAAARDRQAGEYQGIGVDVESVDDVIVVVSPIDGSPAAAAGIRPGDILRRANGVDLAGMSLQDVVELVRGPAGTPITLAFERYGQVAEVEIIRDVIRTVSVRGELLDNNIAYLRIGRFGDKTEEELESTLTDLVAHNPVGLILDLRRNPGGGLESVVAVADQFLTEGTIMRERYGDGQEDQFDADKEGLAQEIPMVVLIDEGSASASEVLAGAIRDGDRGLLVGQTSFGKGTVQSWLTLADGGGVRITIARWLTPDGQWVQGTGLDPDYFIPLPEIEGDQELVDTQLQAAIDLLLGKTVTSITEEEDESRHR